MSIIICLGWIFLFPVTVFSSLISPNYDSEHEEFIKILLGPEFNSTIVSPELNCEIESVINYFKLESNYRHISEDFSRDTFYKMISNTERGSINRVPFFWNPSVYELISKENEMKMNYNSRHSICLKQYFNVSSIPHYPQIFLQMFKTKLTYEEQLVLLRNALESPYLFGDFFKYLARYFFEVYIGYLNYELLEFSPTLNVSSLTRYQNVLDQAKLKK